MSAAALASLDRTIGAVDAEMTALTGAPSTVPHPNPAAGRYMFADGAPRLDEIERLAVEKSKERGWDGKLRSVDHWRNWLMGQYRIQLDIWFSAATREQITARIVRLEGELERLPYSIGSHGDLKARAAALRTEIDAASAERSRAA